MEAIRQSKFICGECNQTFSSLFALAEHGNLHNGNRPFACPECYHTFQQLNEYAAHFRRTHDPIKFESTTDPPCNEVKSSVDLTVLRELPLVSFLSKEKVEKPVSNNWTAAQTTDFTCQDCSKTFSTKKKLSRHKCAAGRGDSTPVDASVLCSCLEKFPSAEEFRTHLGSAPYVCCACKMEFSQINYLKKHIRSHTNEKPFVCLQCNRAFSQRINLKNHMSVHDGEKAVKCELCPFACKTPGGLFKHMKKHKLGLPAEDRRKVSSQEYECGKCGQKFKFERNLGMHMKSHEKDNCLCVECGKILHGARKLADHVRNYHGESYKCTICNKEIRGLNALRFHTKTHQNRTHACPDCRKAFALPEYLRCHMRTHGRRTLHGCTTCDKNFKGLRGLKYHKKICAGGQNETASVPAGPVLQRVEYIVETLVSPIQG